MEIKCWGSRGSIPVSGKAYLKYGGDTTCIEITAKSGETIIIDAGTGIRRLGNSLIERDVSRYHLLFTHAHWDHVLGFAFFKPLQYKKAQVIIQDRDLGGIRTKKMLQNVMKMPFFPIRLSDLNARLIFDRDLENKFDIGSITVETIPTSHPGGGLGYKFTEESRSFVFLTDNELGFIHPGGMSFDACLDFVKGADILFHDGEYTLEEYNRKTGWGHSSIPQIIDLSAKAGIKKLGLFHLNQDRTDKEVDAIVSGIRKQLEKDNPGLDFFAVYCDMTLHL